MSEKDAFDNDGLIRLTFSDGALVMSEERGTWPDCHATYRESGEQLVIHVTGPGCPREEHPMRMKWAIEDGVLRLAPVEPNDVFTRIWWGSEPWRRIADAPAEEASFPEGVYRLSYTIDFLVERGLDRPAAFDQAGVQTLTLENDGFLHQIKGKPPDCRGTYAVADGRVALVIAANESPGCGSEEWEIFNARWMLEGDELRFVDVRTQIDDDGFAQIIWGSKPWRKIG